MATVTACSPSLQQLVPTAAPLLTQSLEKQEMPGRHHPAADGVPILKEPSRRVSQWAPQASQCLSYTGAWHFPQELTCCFSGWRGPFLCSSDPAVPYSSTKTTLSPDALTPCWAYPPASLLWVLAEFPLSWSSQTLSLTEFSELICVALIQNCHFLGSSVSLKLVCSLFSPSLIRIK